MPHPRTLAAFAWDFGLIVAVILVYFLLRAQAPVDVPAAVHVTVRLIDFEKATGLFHERDLQELTLRWDWLKEAANFTYAYLHFPALAAVGVALWVRNRRNFRLVRDTMFISMVIGLLFYYLVPAAPPRLMAAHGHDYGFVDTVFGGTTAVRYPQPTFYVNNYAAIPSYHFGWMALVSAALWGAWHHPAVRSLAIALTAVMTWASAATANHLFVDMIIGGVAVAAAWLLALLVDRRRSRRQPGRRAPLEKQAPG
ncbi:MAG: phosphatase PAP2 family protein [Dehalococcoidia bacterium]|nr:phosphatase PAP2 family protein [Dehalococcoidia bacterium]